MITVMETKELRIEHEFGKGVDAKYRLTFKEIDKEVVMTVDQTINIRNFLEKFINVNELYCYTIDAVIEQEKWEKEQSRLPQIGIRASQLQAQGSIN